MAACPNCGTENPNGFRTAYFVMARAQLEAHGGVVEKFIGDDVVGVFAVPAAHEDDPEGALRAGLRIVEEAEAHEAVGASLPGATSVSWTRLREPELLSGPRELPVSRRTAATL